MHWELTDYKWKPGRPRENWMDVVRRNLKDMDITMKEAEVLAADVMSSICGPMHLYI